MTDEPLEEGDDFHDEIAVACFIGWHDKDDLWGGYTRDQAFEAFARLLSIPAERLMRIVRGEK